MVLYSKILEIIIVNPPVISQKKKDKVPNIGILSITSYLQAQGINAIIYDLIQDSFAELKDLIISQKPLLLGFSCTSAESYSSATYYAKLLKGLNYNLCIIFGGQHISGLSFSDEIVNDYVDCFIFGFGELAIEKIYTDLKLNKTLPKKYYDGSTSGKNFLSLDYTLYPNWKKHIPCVEVVRGCNYSCNFCNAACLRNLNGYHIRNFDSICAEIENIVNLFGEDTDIFLFGPIFGNKINEFSSLLNMLSSLSRRIKYSFNMRVDSDWEAYIDELLELNIRSVFFGLESASESILLNMKKTKDPSSYISKASKTFNFFSNNNIPFFTSLIFGYFGETVDTINETLTFIDENKNNIKALSANTFQIYPGSYDYINLEQLCNKYKVTAILNPVTNTYNLDLKESVTLSQIEEICKNVESKYNDEVYYSRVRKWRFFDE